MKELVSTCVRGEHLRPPRCRSSALLGLEHAPFSAATQELSAPLALGLVLRYHDEFLRLVCLRGSKRTIASSHQRLVSSFGRFLKSMKEVLALERDEVRLSGCSSQRKNSRGVSHLLRLFSPYFLQYFLLGLCKLGRDLTKGWRESK